MRVTIDSSEDCLLIAMLAFAPLALGSVNTWAYCTIAIAALILFDLHFLNNIGALKNLVRRPASIGVLLFLILSLLYVIPLPAQIIKILSSTVSTLREEYMLNPSAWQTLSVYPRATIGYLVKIISYIMVFLVVVSKISSTEDGIRKGHYSLIFLGATTGILSIIFHSLCDFNLHIPANALYFTVMLAIVSGLSGSDSINYQFINKLVNSIIIIGFGIAVFGIIQKLGYNGKIYWVIKKAGDHFGPYVNYDHYAGYMGMCALLAIAQFFAKIASSSLPNIKKLKDKIVWFSSPEANKTLIYLFMAIVMTAALFLTTSRGGIMSFAAALAVFYFVCVISASKRKRKRILLASVLVILLMCIMILWVGPEETVDRFKGLNRVVKFLIKEKSILSEIRPHMWKDTLGLIKDFPVFGTGQGTYYCIFAKYRTFSDRYGLLRYAHNDYIHFISEMGIIGGVFILVFFAWYIRRFRECFRLLRSNR